MSASPWNPDWLVPQWPVPAQVRAVCTTRAGGVSAAPYDALNLGNHVGDDSLHVRHNRKLLQEALGAKPVFLDQVHGTQVIEITHQTMDNRQADGALTRESGVACTVMVADCLPILLCDAKGSTVAAVHAGWRGLAGVNGNGVLEEVHHLFMPVASADSTQPAIELIAWIGPCIGPDAFEVGPDVLDAFVATHSQAVGCFKELPGGKWLANLPALARQRLQALGVSQIYGNDGSPDWCTVGNPLRFFSHRRDRVSGRQAASIWLE